MNLVGDKKKDNTMTKKVISTYIMLCTCFLVSSIKSGQDLSEQSFLTKQRDPSTVHHPITRFLITSEVLTFNDALPVLSHLQTLKDTEKKAVVNDYKKILVKTAHLYFQSVPPRDVTNTALTLTGVPIPVRKDLEKQLLIILFPAMGSMIQS